MTILQRIFMAAAFALMVMSGGSPATAEKAGGDALLMITSPSCPWCEAFEDEVGKGYDNTDEAVLFPIRRVDIDDGMPQDYAHIGGAAMTPTFIFIRDGRELGRITGYPGREMFWWGMSEFTTKTPG